MPSVSPADRAHQSCPVRVENVPLRYIDRLLQEDAATYRTLPNFNSSRNVSLLYALGVIHAGSLLLE